MPNTQNDFRTVTYETEQKGRGQKEKKKSSYLKKSISFSSTLVIESNSYQPYCWTITFRADQKLNLDSSQMMRRKPWQTENRNGGMHKKHGILRNVSGDYKWLGETLRLFQGFTVTSPTKTGPPYTWNFDTLASYNCVYVGLPRITDVYTNECLYLVYPDGT